MDENTYTRYVTTVVYEYEFLQVIKKLEDEIADLGVRITILEKAMSLLDTITTSYKEGRNVS